MENNEDWKTDLYKYDSYKDDIWKWKHTKYSDKDLKQYAIDLYHNKIFTSMQLDENANILTVFMPIMALGNNLNEATTRQGKIENFLKSEALDEYLKEVGKTEEELRKAYYDDLGMIFQYYTEAAPRGINGYPIFFSCHILNKANAKTMLDYYNDYKEKIENIENQFLNGN